MRMDIFLMAVMLVLAAACAGAQELRIERNADTIVCTDNGAPVFTYAYGDVPFKPYVRTLCTPAGVQVLRDAPHDHLHHHALMYALGVNGISLWEETQKGGYQLTEGFGEVAVQKAADFEAAVIAARLAWRDHDKTTALANERRNIALIRADGLGATLLAWRTRLEVPGDVPEITLTGSHYYGLGMRFLVSMDDGKFLNAANADGEIVRGDERNFQAAWCAFASVADGKPVTAAMFDAPGNTRPATWFTMGEATPAFSYLAATLHLYKEPLVLKQGDELDVTYAVVLWDGEAERKEIERVHGWWLAHLAAIKAILK